MSTEQIVEPASTPAVDDTDLDQFSAEFFGQNKAPEPASSKEEVDEEVPDDAPTPDGDGTPEDDTLDDEDDSDDSDQDEPEKDPAPKKKNRFQERIDEVVGKQRETERKLEDALAKLAAAEKKPTPAPAPVVVEDTRPRADDLLEDGTDKYPLGEFDPNFIVDLTKHTLETETKAMQARTEQEAKARVIEDQKAQLATDWEEKLVPAQERYPDFQDKGNELVAAFSNLDQNYAEYLTATIMSMDFGPDVFYYLASNPDEAFKIVGSGATRATVALGRLEAKFADADEAKQKAKPKISKAPTPPPTNRGTAPAKIEVDDTTDDLDAFASKFFKKK